MSKIKVLFICHGRTEGLPAIRRIMGQKIIRNYRSES